MLTDNPRRPTFKHFIKFRTDLVYAMLLKILRKVLNKVGRILSKIEMGISTRIHTDTLGVFNRQAHQDIVISSTKYNMRESPGEHYYAMQYWANFRDYLPPKTSAPTVVDLGCGQGRFTFEFAREYPHSQIVGIDLSPDAIENARAYASSQRLMNVEFVCSSIEDSAMSFDASSIDILLFTEVSIYDPNWRESFKLLCSKVKPGALIIASFRSTYFNVLLLTAERRLADAERVVTSRQGPLSAHHPVHFSWNNSMELVEELKSQNLEVLRVAGIGSCSGITGDPHAKIVRPWDLCQEDQDRLMRVELVMGQVVPDAGRYILIVARNNSH